MLTENTRPTTCLDVLETEDWQQTVAANFAAKSPTVRIAAAQAPALYFLHIEKTAGTSVHKILTDRLPGEALCMARVIDDLDGASAASLKAFRVFSGHFTGGFPDFLGVPLKTVTVLRDPVQRSISHYAHIRRDPGSVHHALARTLSLREFCLHPETRPYIQDYQARCLAGEAREFPIRRVVRAHLPRSDAQRSLLLSRARERLSACAAVGVTEHLATTLAVFCAALGLEWSGPAPYENPSYNRPKTIDGETLALIRELTQCDAALHREATGMLFKRAAETGLAVPAPPEISLKQTIATARSAWPERGHRIKLGLSSAICKLPRTIRIALVPPYMIYRLLVDRTNPAPRPMQLPGIAKLRELKLAAVSRFGL